MGWRLWSGSGGGWVRGRKTWLVSLWTPRGGVQSLNRSGKESGLEVQPAVSRATQSGDGVGKEKGTSSFLGDFHICPIPQNLLIPEVQGREKAEQKDTQEKRALWRFPSYVDSEVQRASRRTFPHPTSLQAPVTGDEPKDKGKAEGPAFGLSSRDSSECRQLLSQDPYKQTPLL